MIKNRPSRPTGVAHGTAFAVDLLRAMKDNEPCKVRDFFDGEEERTGKRPRSCMISCPCWKCNPARM